MTKRKIWRTGTSEIKSVFCSFITKVWESKYSLSLSKLAARLSHGKDFSGGQLERETSGFGSTSGLHGSQMKGLVYRISFQLIPAPHTTKVSFY